MVAQGGITLNMFPNPNHGDQFFISLNGLSANVKSISVDMYDLTGKPVSKRTIAVQDGFVNNSMDLDNDLSSGIYMVHFTAGEQNWTERFVIQK